MKNSIIALFLLSSAAAFANEAADEQMNRAAFAGERTRAEVTAELRQAQNQGAVGVQSEYSSYLQQPSAGFSRSRQAVRAEAVQAARSRVVHELI
jgi:hypothetical protein